MNINLTNSVFVPLFIKIASEKRYSILSQSSLYFTFFWILKVNTSPINLFFPILPVLIFIKKIIDLKYVPMLAIGFYAIFMSSFTYYIALICYFQLVITIIGLYKISRIKYINLPFAMPNDIIEIPNWINTIKKVYQKGQYAFFTVGVLFTIEYIILIPKDIQIFDKYGKINPNISLDFWYTWIIIFMFIVIAFPIIWLFLKKIMTKICVNLQKKASEEIMKQLKYNITNPILIFAQYQLNNIATNYKFLFYSKKNIFPGIATCLSFFLQCINKQYPENNDKIFNQITRIIPASIKLQNAIIAQQDCLKYLNNDMNKFVLLDVPYIGSEYTCSAKCYNYNRFHKSIAEKLSNSDYPFLYYCRSTPPKTNNPYNEQDATYIQKMKLAQYFFNKGFYFEKVYLKEDTELIISNRQYSKGQFEWSGEKQIII